MKQLVNKIHRYLKIYYYTSKVGIMEVLIYRINSLLMGVAPVIWAFTFVIFLSVIFKETKSLGGWDNLELVLLLGVQEIVFMLTWMTTIGNLQEFSNCVKYGKFDLVLLRPLNHRFWVSFNSIDVSGILGLINAILITIFSLVRLGASLFFGRVFFFLLGIIIAYLLVYLLAFIFTSLSFFFVEAGVFHSLLMELWDFGRYPAEIYDNRFKLFLLLFVPVLFLSYVPSAILLGKLPWYYDLLGLLLVIILNLISSLIWRKGLRRYQSASS